MSNKLRLNFSRKKATKIPLKRLCGHYEFPNTCMALDMLEKSSNFTLSKQLSIQNKFYMTHS